ncbi:MAG: tRNA guanosine(15) transglycosylase TgtA [Promethearchaeota archaeon]
MNYEIIDLDALGRIGKIKIGNKEMITPNLFPVVHPYKNIIKPSELKSFGAQGIFTNAYIIYQNKQLKEDVLKKGIHRYLDFNGLIATDCGAFQQYMYNNDKLDIDPETIEKFQEDIDSEFPVILDIPVQLDDDYKTAKNKVLTTLDRAKDNIKRRKNKNCYWIGPIHGGKYYDLLKLSSLEMNKLDFGFYAIGGLVKALLDYRFDLTLKILLSVKKYITPDKPLHMFGLGLPQFFSLAVACGCDLMDSAAYILFAKENRYFTLSTGTKKLEELEEFPCHCPICCKYNPKEIRSTDEALRIELIAKHNLYISFSELKTIRQAIREGNLWELVEQRIRNHPSLMDAANVIKEYYEYFEIYEKIYKNHGRLFASKESINRPIIYRYERKLKTTYRVPIEAKYLIILPELDLKSKTSPTIKKWLHIINKTTIIPRKFLHVVFITEFYGIIPLELSETFPLGQYESITSSGKNDLIYENSLKKTEIFLNLFSSHYKKCGVLIPNKFINQFGEEVDFSTNNPIHGLSDVLKSKFDSNFSIFNNLEDLIYYFKAENNK